LVRQFKSPEEKKKIIKKKTLPSYLSSAKKELSGLFDSGVSIKLNDSGKGQINVSFKNKKDFLRILNILKSEK